MRRRLPELRRPANRPPDGSEIDTIDHAHLVLRLSVFLTRPRHQMPVYATTTQPCRNERARAAGTFECTAELTIPAAHTVQVPISVHRNMASVP